MNTTEGRRALVLIGFQNDYFAADGVLGGALEDHAGVAHCLVNSQLLIEAFLAAGDLVIATPIQFQSGYPELSDPVGILKTIKATGAFQAGRSGSELIPEHTRFGDCIRRVPGRHGLNAFFDTDLNAVLAGHDVAEVVISGVVTSLCVDSTARSAHERGYAVTIVEDATAGRTAYEQEFYTRSVFPMYADVRRSAELIGQ